MKYTLVKFQGRWVKVSNRLSPPTEWVTVINKANDMATKIFSLTPSEQQAKWDDIMGQMCAYVDDTNADVDMAYDWVCEMLNIDSFVDNKTAWDSFYETWASCDNRNDLNTFAIV